MPALHEMNTRQHAIFWWRLKVIGGVLLILQFILGRLSESYAGNFPVLINIESALSQALILISATLFVYHYYLLKRHNPSITQPDFLVSEQGLYRWIRHPMYFADLWLYLGFTLMHCSLVAMLIYGISLIALIRQAEAEDRYLARCFPNAHREWSQGTWLLIPWLY